MCAHAQIAHKREILCPVIIVKKRSELMHAGLEQVERIDYLRADRVDYLRAKIGRSKLIIYEHRSSRVS